MRYEDKDDFQNHFGTLNAEQLWALTKMLKHARLRCRSNAAFNNYMNRMFPYARFEQVNKGDHDGLSITINED